jgi:membrane protein
VHENAKLPAWRRFAHFWILVFKSFNKNRGPVRASSLAYTTVLSLIPVLAVVVSISTGFLQHDDTTIDTLMDRFVTTVAPQLDLIQADDAAIDEVGGSHDSGRKAVVEKIKSYINTINSGTLGLTAGIALIFIAISVLSSVENTFNDIWGVTRGRSWSARVVQYWAAITLAPVFIITAVALTTGSQIVSASKEDASARATFMGTNKVVEVTNRVATTQTVAAAGGSTNSIVVKPVVKAKIERPNAFQRAVAAIVHMPVLGKVIEKLGPFVLPFIILTLFLAIFYKLMPATRVHWDAAFVAGLVGGCLLQLNNLFNVVYISKVVTYSKIYGSLGAVPIFLVGLYFSWIIILLGSQVGYAYQNRQAYVQEKQAETINQRGREFVAMRMMTFIGQRFDAGEKLPSRSLISQHLGVPSQLACQVLTSLVAADLLVEVSNEETAYAPARPIDKISAEDILAALRVGQGTELATCDDPERAVVRHEYDRIFLAEMQAAAAVTLKELVRRATPAAKPAESEKAALSARLEPAA